MAKISTSAGLTKIEKKRLEKLKSNMKHFLGSFYIRLNKFYVHFVSHFDNLQNYLRPSNKMTLVKLESCFNIMKLTLMGIN